VVVVGGVSPAVKAWWAHAHAEDTGRTLAPV
jgi:hypothetical protein